MKIPKTFIPEKDLEKKTEELIEAYREISLEELMRNNWYILHGNETTTQRSKNLMEITSQIVDGTLENKIKWEECVINDPEISKGYKAKVVIQNYNKEPITVQVFFLISEPRNFVRYGQLYLGSDKGLGLNGFAESIKIARLITEYFK